MSSHDEEEANRFYRHLFQDILDALGKDLHIAKHVVERHRSEKRSDRENLKQTLLEASRHVTQTVVTSWNEIFADKPIHDKRIAIEIGEDEPANASPPAEPMPGRVWVRFALEDSDGLFSVKERSLGFRWFFVYLMLTTYRGRRGGPGDMLFLFDEPASNLHPTAQAALLSSLDTLSEDAVVIYATHSHHLINPTWLETTFVVANQGLDPEAVSADFSARRTDIRITPYRRFAANHPDQSHFFQPILDVLDYAPSDLEMVPEVAMVEGKSDFYLLAYYEQVFLGTPKNKALRFLPGGGAGTMDDVIQFYIAWATPFVVLLDSDAAGDRQAERYREKFGAIVEHRIVQVAEASGKRKAKNLEELLTKTDHLKFQQIVNEASTTYDKKTFSRGVQEALVAKHKIELTKTAQTVLARAVETLRERIATDEV